MRRPVACGLLLAAVLLPATAGASAETAFARGRRLEAQGDFAGATLAYREVLRGNPIHPQAWDRLRAVFGRNLTVAEATEGLRREAMSSPDFVALNLLGVLYGKEREWGLAIEALEAAVRLEPRAADARVNLGWIFLELRRYPEAIAQFQDALAIQPALARAHAGLASALVEARGDYPTAVGHYRTAVALDPGNPGLWNDLGWLYYKMGQYDRAILALEKAAGLDGSSAMVRTNLGLAHYKQGGFDRAVEVLEDARQLAPGYDLALYGLGKTFAARGEYDKALQAYWEAWRASRNDLYLLLYVGTYFESRRLLVALFLFAFLVIAGGTAFWILRSRRAGAAAAGA
ncbi:MAG: tetratricopeptide repeat protein [Candidatus Methylomirabilales bacterium]